VFAFRVVLPVPRSSSAPRCVLERDTTDTPLIFTLFMSSPVLPSDALPQGHALSGGAYVVDSLLGRGGFGLTYLCAEPALLRWVAVKELFPPGATRNGAEVVAPRGTSSDDWLKARRAFASEARKLAGFADAAIVRVYGVWEENGTAYLAMEALDGGSLGANLKASGPFTPKRTCELGIDLCRALGILHEGNLLHRDLKPDNIFFAADGSPVLIDFGNARRLVAHQTQTMSLALTPGYAPPEAYSSRGAFSPASDIYSLGATLWECLTGSPPPDATDRVLGAPLPDLLERAPMCPPILTQTLVRALELKPENRFQSARDMMALLADALQLVLRATAIPMAIPSRDEPANISEEKPRLPWQSDLTNCPNCGRPVNILDRICPHCGRFKNGYVPGQHLERRSRINQSWNVWARFFIGAVFLVLVIGVVERGGRAMRAATGASYDSYSDTGSKLRAQSTEFRRSLAGSENVSSVRPQFGSGSIDIVATPAWQALNADDRLEVAKRWANQWRNSRAPLPAPFQITDKEGTVLGGRVAGAAQPWLR
jgi:serine/threonine protein kinase